MTGERRASDAGREGCAAYARHPCARRTLLPIVFLEASIRLTIRLRCVRHWAFIGADDRDCEPYTTRAQKVVGNCVRRRTSSASASSLTHTSRLHLVDTTFATFGPGQELIFGITAAESATHLPPPSLRTRPCRPRCPRRLAIRFPRHPLFRVSAIIWAHRSHTLPHD